MKRFLAGALAVLTLAALTACGGTDKETDSAPANSSAAQSAAADPTAYTIDYTIPETFAETDSGAEGTLLYAADDGSTITITIHELPADADSPISEEEMRS